MGLVFSCTKENNAIEPDSSKLGIIADSSKIYDSWQEINYRYSNGSPESIYEPTTDLIIYTFKKDGTFSYLKNEKITEGTFTLEEKDGATFLNMSNSKSFMVRFKSENELILTPFPLCIEGCWYTLHRQLPMCGGGLIHK